MASSVSSECVFSSIEITISKCHNHLKADVMEILQFLMYSIRSSVLVQKDPLLTPEVHSKQDSGDNDGGE